MSWLDDILNPFYKPWHKTTFSHWINGSNSTNDSPWVVAEVKSSSGELCKLHCLSFLFILNRSVEHNNHNIFMIVFVISRNIRNSPTYLTVHHYCANFHANKRSHHDHSDAENESNFLFLLYMKSTTRKLTIADWT